MELSVSARIGRAVADVWRWYAEDHVRNHPRWDPDMQLTQVSPGPLRLGSVVHRRNTRWGAPVEGEMEITEWEPGVALGTNIRDANMEMDGRVRFESTSSGETLLTISAKIPGLDDARAAVLHERMDRTIANIKALVEAET